MAVVAVFPFSTCFTSEDVEELDSLQKPYNVCNQDDNEQSPDTGLIDGSDDIALATVGEKKCPSSVPSGETRPATDGDPIDDLFEEALKDDDSSDDGDSGHVDNDVKDDCYFEMETQLTTTTSDSDSVEEGLDIAELESLTVDKYGGLMNLGNTCYMASALQMVASLDGFTHELEKVPVLRCGAIENDDTDSEESCEQEPSLRHAFLDVMASLENGETISPTEFKQALDKRTTLFLGYHQEDSHEFLTTLFDLLDADYKAKKEEKSLSNEDSKDEAELERERDEGEADENDGNETIDNQSKSSVERVMEKNDENLPDNREKVATYNEESHLNALDEENGSKASANSSEEDEEKALSESKTGSQTTDNDDKMVVDVEDLEKVDEKQPSTAAKVADVSTASVDQQCSESVELTSKRPRNEEMDENIQQVGTAKLRDARLRVACQSFSNLQPEGIEELLNARLLVNSCTGLSTTTPSPPKCKLAGGRMPASEANGTVLFTSISSPSLDTPQLGQDSTASVPTPLSPVESYLQTEVRVRLTCESCSYTRSHLENFLHLSLEIGTDDENMTGNVADGLRKFFAPERREVKCEKCFHNSAVQKMEITKLPRALLLHFKRFIVDISDDYTSITYRKNQSEVMFDSSLEFDGVLSEFVSDDFCFPHPHEAKYNMDCCYKIRAVVNHIGSSAACGHYTADAFRDFGGERRWNRFNDSYVSDISSEEAIGNSTRTAYMVMYELSPAVV